MTSPRISLRSWLTARRPYAATFAMVLLGAALRLAIDPIAGDFYAFTIFYAIVPLIAWRYGLRVGLVALGSSALLVHYVLLEPAWVFGTEPRALLGLGLFLVIGFALALLGDGIRRSRGELHAKAAELEKEVAERKAAEADVTRLNTLLKERVEELQAVINASPIAIGVATDAACEHIWGNQAFADLLGVPPDNNISTTAPAADPLPFTVYREGDEAPSAELPMHRSAAHGVSVRDAEIEVVRRDGRRVTLLGNAAPLYRATGEVRGSVGVFVDITERKAAEREREEENRRKDEFLATLAHELRNPLAPLRNAASIVRQQGKNDQKLQWAGAVIERQVRHMVRLVDDLLDVGRITRGLIALQKETVDLRLLVWQAVELARPLLDERKQQLRVELPMGPLPLHVDRVRLVQVISNILSNAIKYTPEQGAILISAKEDGAAMTLRIRDTGAGIAPDLLPRVFDLFVQGDRSLARAEGGLGIGLTLVKKIVELHDGTVVASSQGTGKGAEFTVTLPAAGGVTVADGAAPVASAAASRKILVVDDNADIADTLAVLLDAGGHEAHVAYTAEAALDLARRVQPDLAFVDIGLPGMDGYELARRFRADPALQRIHLVALSGYGRAVDRARSAAAGFERHLTKPFDPDHLQSLLHEIFGPAPGGSPVTGGPGHPAELRDAV